MKLRIALVLTVFSVLLLCNYAMPAFAQSEAKERLSPVMPEPGMFNSLMKSLADQFSPTVPGFSQNDAKERQVPVMPQLGKFNSLMKNLADQLDHNAIGREPSSSYIITSFTNLDKLGDTGSLGRLIAENLMYGLQTHKWQLLEVRLTKGIDVNAAGEFSLSRDVSKLKDEYKIRGVVTGTYSIAEGNLTINARAIDVNTGLLISSAQTYIPLEWLPESALPGAIGHGGMKIVNDGIR